MKQIPLTQNQVALVDDHWFGFLNRWKWYARWDKTIRGYYAVRYDPKLPNKKAILMHRVVAQTPDGMICDHIHHRTLDNREEELRNVTPTQSTINRGIQKNNKTGITGISIRGGKYRVALKIKGKQLFDKAFTELKDAIKARKRAEKKYFGGFAFSGDK